MGVRSAVAWYGVVAVLAGAGSACAATYAIPYEFQPAPDGAAPRAPLVAVGGLLYGTTFYGGSATGKGVGSVFSFNPATGAETVLTGFGNGSGGTGPSGGLTPAGGLLYGTARFGGATGPSCTTGCGTLFSVDPVSGAKVTVHTFTSTEGVDPVAPLLNVGGILYGTTEGGGPLGEGTVFSFNPATGTQKVVYSFKGLPSDGATPIGGLIYSGGKLYGTTVNGGTGGWGTVFSIDRVGHEKVLHGFSNGSDGGWPQAALTAFGGLLYGTTSIGGTVGAGTVFSVDPASGAEAVVHAFQGLDGATPLASLLSFKGHLVGTTQAGGSANLGTVFSLAPATGALTTVHSFTGRLGNDGAQPVAPLINVNGTLYGTATAGGVPGFDTHGDGTIFSLMP